MACNNTTYIELINSSISLQLQLHKYSFHVENLNYNIPTAMLVSKCVTPIWIVIGLFGNIISALVWASPRMRTCSTVSYYLTCLAIADLTFLILHFIYELENPWLLGTLDVQGWCQIFSMANIAVQYFCVFLVFAFTVERFLSVCYPFKSERFGKSRTPRTIFCLFVLSLILSIPQGYFWIINVVGECLFRPSEGTMLSPTFFAIYTWCTELFIFLLLPVIVLFLNVTVIYKIRSVGKLKIGRSSNIARDVRAPFAVNDTSMSALVAESESLQATQPSRNNGGYSSSNKGSTATLLWVSFYLIFTMLPNTFMYAMQYIVPYGPMPCRIEDMAHDPTWRAYFNFTAVRIIIKEISLSHHVGNVFIYMATSRRFLKLTIQSFCRRPQSVSGEPRDTSLHAIRVTQTRFLGDGV
ncbi:unnamed protein product [Candidula unifasciata]|uniref:G-protein coupled receptors family 1 profile domain-containing protein n=1 Tax=Candidula unifasciata TaxID=100452 RepID=A0A8S3YN08_9EUPU|nr:unnamed protein product [Candidula unifasciata]